MSALAFQVCAAIAYHFPGPFSLEAVVDVFSRYAQETNPESAKKWKISGDPSTELILAASSTICNLLLEFSPAKEPLMQQGLFNLSSRFAWFYKLVSGILS